MIFALNYRTFNFNPMKTLLYTTIIAIGLILMACPYEGEVEISTYEEATKIDKKIIDKWVSFNEDGGRIELDISKLGKNVLDVSHKQFDVKNRQESKENYRVYGTEIGEHTIFNIEMKNGKYLFSEYAWTGKNELYLELIDAEFMEENFKEDNVTTKKLNEFLTKNIHKKELFGDKLEFYRKDSPEYNKVRTFMRKSGF